MRRREFITFIGGVAIAAPVLSRAAEAAMPVIGYLGLGSAAEARNVIDRFHRGLNEMGFVEGQNVAIEYRWGEGSYARMPDLAADLVRQRVAVICTTSNVGALAAKAATSDIPILFVFGIDPVCTGLVSSLNRPGGNATGVAFLTSALEPKSEQRQCRNPRAGSGSSRADLRAAPAPSKGEQCRGHRHVLHKTRAGASRCPAPHIRSRVRMAGPSPFRFGRSQRDTHEVIE